jgi:hypothetical protein
MVAKKLPFAGYSVVRPLGVRSSEYDDARAGLVPDVHDPLVL